MLPLTNSTYKKNFFKTYLLFIGLLYFSSSESYGRTRAGSPINNAPTDITMPDNQIGENLIFNTTVGNLFTTDADAIDVHTYSFAIGVGDDDNEDFSVSTDGHLSAKFTLNYEEKSSYTVRVQTDDGNGGTFQKAFTIEVVEAPEAPTNILLSNSSFLENQALGTTIGTFSAVDQDVGETYVYRFSGNNPSNAFFDIVGSELQTGSFFDYETRSFYVITVEVEDSRGRTYQRSHSISVVDLVENQLPTNLLLSSSMIPEANSISDAVGTFSTTDADFGDTHTYSLVFGLGSTNNSSFFVSEEGELRAAEVFDFEVKNDYSIRVRTTDSGGGYFEKAFTITVTNIDENTAPSSNTLSSSTIDENNSLFDAVGSFMTTDADSGDTHTYALVAGGGSGDNGSFRISGNELQANTEFDFETKSSYSIRVRTVDSQSNSLETNHTITINDLTDVALDFALNNNNVNEHVANGAFVGMLVPINAMDPAQVNFQFVAGAGDTDNVAFNRSGRDISINSSPDFETKEVYSIRVEANDQGNLEEKILLIHINDLNEAPTAINLSGTTILENTAVGQIIGELSTEDQDAGDSFTYAFEGAQPFFTLDGAFLKTAAMFDFETDPTTYNIEFRTTDDGGLTTTSTLQVQLINGPEAPTDITLSSNTVNEHGALSALIGNFSTSDPEGGQHFYSLVPGVGASDNNSFIINTGSSSLFSDIIFDFEAKSSYEIRVESRDQDGNTFSKPFTINISDIDESMLQTRLEISSESINEGNAVGDVVGVLSTTGANSGTNHTYTLAAGVNDDDNGSFTIVGNELRAGEVFEEATKGMYVINIRSESIEGDIHEQTVQIGIDRVNNLPSDLTISSSEIFEGNTIGKNVGLLSTTDADGDESYVYTLVGGVGADDNARFATAGSFLKAEEIFDFEVENSYSIRIRTEDGNGGAFEKAINITVVDEPEVPTALNLSATSLDENNAVDQTIGTFTTDDPDNGSTFSYSILFGANGDHLAFAIDDDELKAVGVLDREVQSSYQISVRSTDSGGDAITEDFTITITDINEEPTDIIFSSTNLDENNDIGDVVADLSTEDQDAGSSHTYVFINNPDNAFTIDGAQLKAAIVFDFETQNSYNIQVESSDNGGLTYDEDLVITINDLAENSPPTDITLDNTSITELNSIGDAIGQLTTTDVDVGNTHTYTLVPGVGDTDNASFAILGNELQANEVFDFEVKNTYSLRIRSTDNETGFFEKNFSITIVDGPDLDVTAPTILSFSPPDNSTGVLLDADLVVTFNEPISAGTGNIRVSDVRNGIVYINGHAQQGLDVFSVSGNTLTIHMGGMDLNRNFSEALDYFVTISNGAVMDLSGNTFAAGWTTANETEWNFQSEKVDPIFSFTISDKLSTADPFVVFAASNTGAPVSYSLISGPATIDGNMATLTGELGMVTVQADLAETEVYKSASLTTSFNVTDGVPPTLVSLSPLTNASGVPIDGTLVATFDEPIQAGTGQMWIRRSVGNGIAQNASFATTPELLSVEGNELTFHLDNLAGGVVELGTSYYAILFDDIVEDVSGNGFADGFVATDRDSWFFAIEKLAPTLSLDPIDDKFTFEAPFDASANTNNAETSIAYSIVSGPATVMGNTISLTGAEGTVIVMASLSETATYGPLSVTTTFDVTDPGDVFGPEIVSFSPEDNGTGVALDADLVITFDEPVAAGDGFVYVRKSPSGSFVLSGSVNDNSGRFSVDGSTLTIHLASAQTPLELNTSYHVLVDEGSVVDALNNGFEDAFLLNAGDNERWNFTTVNPPPTGVALASTSIDENAAVQTTVGVLTSVDPNDGDTHLYGLTNDADGAFTIDGDELKTNIVFDFEAQNSYNITVRTADTGGGFFDEDFTIAINDTNDAPSEVLLDKLNIEENNELNAVIGSLTVSDQDAGDLHSFSLTGGLPDNDQFSFSGNQLIALSSFDFETKASYTIQIQAEDGNGGSVQENFTITITDVFEDVTPPTVVSLTPPSGSTGVFFDQDIVIEFSEPIQASEANVFGFVRVRETGTFSGLSGRPGFLPDQVTIDGSTLTIHLANGNNGAGIRGDGDYHVLVENNLVRDLAGNYYSEGAQTNNETFWTFSTVKRAQNITLTPIATQLISAPDFEVEAMVDSDLSLSYSVSGPASIDGTTISLTGEAGTVTLTVTQEGDQNYFSVSAEETFEVFDPFQEITFAEIQDQEYGEALALSATASSGLSVTYELIEGVGTFVDDELLITGTGTYTLRASQAGNETFDSASPVEYSFEVLQAQLTLTVDDQESTFGAAIPDLTGTFVGVKNEDNVTVDYETIANALSSAGTYEITASLIDPDGRLENYNVSNTSGTLTITKENQEIIFESLASKTFGDESFQLSATGGLGGSEVTFVSSDESVVAVVGSTATIVGAGSAMITANQVGTENYEDAAPVIQELIVNKRDQEIIFDLFEDKVFGNEMFDLVATGGASGSPVIFSVADESVATISGSTVEIVGVGSTTISASQSGTNNFNDATTVSQDLVVGMASQTILFPSLEDRTFGDVPFELEASGGASGNPITYTSSNEAVAIVDGSSVTIIGAGTTSFMAQQAGSENYFSAESVSKELVVGKATLVATADDKTRTYDTENPMLTISYRGFVGSNGEVDLEQAPTASSVATSASDVGTYAITVIGGVDGNYDFEYVDGAMVVQKASATIEVSNLMQEVDGTSKSPTVNTNPAGLNFNIAFEGGSTPINAGAYDFTVTIDETNYSGSMQGTMTLEESEALGLEETNVSFYPNPVSDYVIVESVEELQVDILDSSGRKQLSSRSNRKIDLDKLSDGLYLIRVLDENGGGKILRVIKRKN